ncbi:MAG TPA: FHA domain-containing protein, partial [Polyangiaceae bacterium]
MTATSVVQVVVTEPGSRRTTALSFPPTETVWIGRDPACHVVLPSKRVSRRHVALDVEGASLRATDASSNGTTLSGETFLRASRTLGTHATLVVGGHSVDVRLEPPSAAPPLGSPLAQSIPERPGPSEVAAAPGVLRRRVHRMLLDHLDLSKISAA